MIKRARINSEPQRELDTEVDLSNLRISESAKIKEVPFLEDQASPRVQAESKFSSTHFDSEVDTHTSSPAAHQSEFARLAEVLSSRVVGRKPHCILVESLLIR